MERLLYLFLLIITGNLYCCANETEEVERFFNNYVNAANNYDTDYFKYYSDNAKIIRVVEKPDGTTKEINIPLERYKSEAKKSKALAKIRKYKNKYLNIKVTKQGNDYKISAYRMPSTSDYKIPAEFLIGKDKNGEWKIKKESMNTRVQIFLHAS